MLHIATTYLSSTLILLAGLFLLLLVVPDKEEWRYLKISRTLLFWSYTILALSGILSILYEFKFGPIGDRRAITLSVAFFQALLFTFTSIAYIRPRYLTVKKVLISIAAILPFAGLAACSSFIGTWALYVAAGVYLLLMGGCTWVFLREYRLGQNDLEQHFDEDLSDRIRWVRVLFFGAEGIGLLALVYSVFNTKLWLYDCFVLAHTLFYIYVINRMRFCLHNGRFLVDVVTSEQKAKRSADVDKQSRQDEDSKLDHAIKQWLDEEKYLISDMSIDDVADALQATHDELNEWCTIHYGLLFRTWRMQLRIEKAKQILSTRPDIKIAELQELTGFTDKSHFFKQFKQITGMTPTEFRKSLQK